MTENTPRLETERLILRRFTQDDAQALFSILGDREVNTFLPMFPLKTLEEACIFLNESYLKQYKAAKGHRYAICFQKDNIPIGYLHVSEDDSHDLGYGLKREVWRKGIAAEAAKAVIGQLKNEGYLYITGTHDVNNPRSGGVMKKIGMRYQYSYEEQWQPKDIKVTFRMYQLNLDGNKERVYEKYRKKYPVHFVEKDV